MHSYKLNVDVSLCIHMSAMPINNNVLPDISGARIIVIAHIGYGHTIPPYLFCSFVRQHLHQRSHMPTNTGPFIYVHPSNDHAAHLAHFVYITSGVAFGFRANLHINAIFLFIRVANIYTYHHTTQNEKQNKCCYYQIHTTHAFIDTYMYIHAYTYKITKNVLPLESSLS